MFGLGLSLDLASLRGGGAVSAYAAFALAMDYDSANYNVSGTRYPLITNVPGYTFTRQGAVGFTNLAGGIDYFAAGVPAINDRGYHAYGALTNLLLNAGSSAVLATQSVTVTAIAHTISFIGTGSVTLSGAFVGSLAGTSATNQVSLNFTPTAAPLIITVTADVRFAGLMVGTLGGAVPIIATGATTAGIGESAMTGIDVPTLTSQGMLIFAHGTSADITAGRYLMHLSDGTDSNRLGLWFSTDTPALFKVAAGVFSQIIVGPAVVSGEKITIVFRILAGVLEGARVKNGALSAWVAMTAGFPAGMNKVDVGGSRLAGSPFKGVVPSAHIKNGTFDTDAKVLAVVAETT